MWERFVTKTTYQLPIQSNTQNACDSTGKQAQITGIIGTSRVARRRSEMFGFCRTALGSDCDDCVISTPSEVGGCYLKQCFETDKQDMTVVLSTKSIHLCALRTKSVTSKWSDGVVKSDAIPPNYKRLSLIYILQNIHSTYMSGPF